MNHPLPFKLSTLGLLSFTDFHKEEDSLAEGRHWAGKRWWRLSIPGMFSHLCSEHGGWRPESPISLLGVLANNSTSTRLTPAGCAAAQTQPAEALPIAL